jgi:hypothetical protein
MNKEETRLLLNQFYLGDITIDEERRLVNLLLSDDCPEDLRAERHAIISLARKEAIDMPEDLKQNIISTIRTTNTGRSHRWVMGIAAGLLLVLGFFLWSLLPKDRKPEHNPQETLAETIKSVQPIQPIRQPILPPAVTNTPPPKSAVKHTTIPKPNKKERERSQAANAGPSSASPADIPVIDLAAEVAGIIANIDQIEQQILVTNPQNNK